MIRHMPIIRIQPIVHADHPVLCVLDRVAPRRVGRILDQQIGGLAQPLEQGQRILRALLVIVQRCAQPASS